MRAVPPLTFQGGYKFRVDYLGYSFWTDAMDVPTTLSYTMAIPHQDVTITVNRVYGTETTPLVENIKVYLFTEGGAYQGIFANTDAQGQVTFSLPDTNYKVRADYMASRYWSDAFNQQDAEVRIDHGIIDAHVTFNGQDLAGAAVYLFTETGSYLSWSETTDGSGYAVFDIPAKAYKLRIDHGGTQYWSDVVNVLAYEETSLESPLEQLAFDLTHNPYPVRLSGAPPVFRGGEIRVATIGSLTGLLVHSVVSQVPSEKVFYFLNDHLGTPQKVVNENGEVVWSADYSPFGDVGVTSSAVENNFRFPGQYYDQATGLHYNYHRYYDPRPGRYLTPDPIGLVGGVNFFMYSNNNPINLIDPLGLDFVSTYTQSLRSTNRFFFSGVTKLSRSALGLLTAGATARTYGTVTPLQALCSLPAGGFANLAALGTLAAAGANSILNALQLAAFLEGGIGFGSLINAHPIYGTEQSVLDCSPLQTLYWLAEDSRPNKKTDLLHLKSCQIAPLNHRV